jgi:MFS family permease
MIADRVGPRPVVVGGLLLIAAGLVLAAGATSLWQIYLGYGHRRRRRCRSFPMYRAWRPYSAGSVRKRGTAAGLAVAGIGVGTLIGAPLAHELIAAVGWRKT